MASEIISESIMVIATVVLVGLLAGALFYTVSTMSTTMSSFTVLQAQRLVTDLQVVYATNTSSTQVVVYLQNVGEATVFDLGSSQLYFGPQGQLQPIGYNGAAPSWTTSASTLSPGQTVQLTITLSSPLSQNQYYTVMFVTSTGYQTSYTFQVT
ncbi:flagellar protein FlaG [Sulfodiicoccus acidiphilus]|uniref:Flagellar protein FlaG n=1 Tax=Sulfodiicoccus acidiphilus TaxID=1670455 RepID=A0A348B4X8_9CREN|nr:flagellar biosynthesis protein FlaG [Sulfodiicoccus acidiphilus]BBD73230.1 flagellar protein FlaG [Sulfodiicoccus acidiphilus]GGT89753.1 flagellar protein FlaG [Sulfodiicoccus acidiphilus]